MYGWRFFEFLQILQNYGIFSLVFKKSEAKFLEFSVTSTTALQSGAKNLYGVVVEGTEIDSQPWMNARQLAESKKPRPLPLQPLPLPQLHFSWNWTLIHVDVRQDSLGERILVWMIASLIRIAMRDQSAVKIGAANVASNRLRKTNLGWPFLYFLPF